MKEIKALNELLKWLKRLKKGVLIAPMMILALSMSGCVTERVTSSFCLWAKPIQLLTKETDTLSPLSKRQIDDFNQEYHHQCK